MRLPSGRPIRRRTVLNGGLVTFASLVAGRVLPGCDGPASTPDANGLDAAIDPDAFASDAPIVDSAIPPDAFSSPFIPNEMPARPALRSLISSIGPLGTANADGVRVPPGFTARILAVAGEEVSGTGYTWHTYPDGGTCFATTDGGWIYVSNSEMPLRGGVGALRFDASGAIVSAQRILDRTNINCAGGGTPWGSWLSCEEVPRGMVYECDPHGMQPPQARPALGVFKHEAVTVDADGRLYLTEDHAEGCFYRFTPAMRTAMGHPDLRSGTLHVAEVAADGAVTWHEVPDPQFLGDTDTREQVAAATHFDGGEGIWFHEGIVYFSSKGDSHVRAYDVAAESISVLYDAATHPDPILDGVDNLTVTCCGDVLVAEDGGDMQIVAILPDGTLKALVQIEGQDDSEITGPAFDPSGTRLYFSSQRGGTRNLGVTYVIEGPFHEPV